MNTKQCSGCKKTKSLSEYHKGVDKDGYSRHCKKCALRFNQKYNKANKQKVVATRLAYKKQLAIRISEWKETIGCYICDEHDPGCIDLHHLDESKKEVNPSALARHGPAAFTIEASKCVPLCANCHRKVHHSRLSLIIDPGWNINYLTSLERLKQGFIAG